MIHAPASRPLPAPPQHPPQQTGSQRKVAIPRLQTAEAPTPSRRQRVTHACEACKRRKVKCTGEKPRCKHCIDFNLSCTYAGSRKDRFKRSVVSTVCSSAISKLMLHRDYARINDVNTEILHYLRGLSTRVGAVDQGEIQRLLELVCFLTSTACCSLCFFALLTKFWYVECG